MYQDLQFYRWRAWLASLHPNLGPDARVRVPAHLAHPSRVGFARAYWTKHVGQVADWVASIPDGSRLHVHELADGRLYLHRDRHDPTNGPVKLVRHIVEETSEGPALLSLGFILGLAALYGRKAA